MFFVVLAVVGGIVSWFVWKKYSLSITTYEPQDFYDIADKVLAGCDTVDAPLKTWNTKVAGISYHDYKNYTDGIVVGLCEWEKTNMHDQFALRMRSWCKRKIGYVPKDGQGGYAVAFRSFTVKPALVCELKSFSGNASNVCGEVTMFIGRREDMRSYIVERLTEAYNNNVSVLS